MERLFTISVFFSATLSALLAMTMVCPGGASPFLTAEGSGLATLALFASLPLVDEGVLAGGRRVGAYAAGVSIGIPLFFFMRQQQMAQGMGMRGLAVGADRVLATAFVLSLLVRGARIWIRSYRRGRSNRPC